MKEKFVVKISTGAQLSTHENQDTLLIQGMQPLTGIAHNTEAAAIAEIESNTALYDTAYRIDKYFVK